MRSDACILCEPHAHTSEVSACGRLRAREVAARVRDAGYQLLVITDHFAPERITPGAGYKRAVELHFAGFEAAREAGGALGLPVLAGMEVRFEGSWEDYLVYGLTREDLFDLGYCLNMRLGAFRKAVNARGGLVYQAHPFRDRMRRAAPRDIDGVEVLNLNPRHDSRNDQARRFAEDNGLLMLAGSDIHQAGDEGGAGVLLPAMPADEKELARMLGRLGPEAITAMR